MPTDCPGRAAKRKALENITNTANPVPELDEAVSSDLPPKPKRQRHPEDQHLPSQKPKRWQLKHQRPKPPLKKLPGPESSGDEFIPGPDDSEDEDEEDVVGKIAAPNTASKRGSHPTPTATPRTPASQAPIQEHLYNGCEDNPNSTASLATLSNVGGPADGAAGVFPTPTTSSGAPKAVGTPSGLANNLTVYPDDRGDQPNTHTRVKGYYETKVLEAVKGITVLARVEPTMGYDPAKPAEDPFAWVYTHETEDFFLRPERGYRAEVAEVTGMRRERQWEFRAVDDDVRVFIRRPIKHFTQSQAMAICEKLVDALKRWPDVSAITRPTGRTFGPPRRITTALFKSAQASAVPDSPLRSFAPVVTARNWEATTFPSVTVCVLRIDPVTLEAHDEKFNGPLDLRGGHLDATNMIFCTNSNWNGELRLLPDGTYPSRFEDSGVPDKYKDAVVRAEGYLRRFAEIWLRRPILMTSADAKAFRNRVAQSLADDTAVYASSKIHGTRRSGGYCTDILTSTRARRDLSGDLPSLRLHSWDQSWLEPVIRPMVQEFKETGDVLHAWTVAAAAADAVNEKIYAGEHPPSACRCQTPEESDARHPCGECGLETACSSLASVLSRGTRACPSCLSTVNPGTNAVETTFNQILRRLIRDELTRSESDIDPEEVGQAAVRQVEGQFRVAGADYIDKYSGSRGVSGSRVAKHPLNPSVDAMFPIYWSAQFQRLLIHCAENVVVTSQALNYLKFVYLPMFLVKLRQYYERYLKLKDAALTGDTHAVKDLQAFRDQFIGTCRVLTDIRMKVPYRREDRMNMNLSRRQYRYYMKQCVSGKMPPGSRVEFERRYTQKIRYRQWDRDTIWRLLRIIRQMEHWLGVDLARGDDGCPYFGHPSTRPADWSWKNCTLLMAGRWNIMRWGCNKYWKTIDTPNTIYLECCFQACVGRMVVRDDDPEAKRKRELQHKYAEFLGLPLGVENYNPLTFAVAHRVHGQQMRTGWRADPTSLEDRVDADNNILIEAKCSNFYKHDYHERLYPLLKEMVLAIEIPLEYANEDLPVDEYDPCLEPGGTVVDYGDEDGVRADYDGDEDEDMGVSTPAESDEAGKT